MGISSFKSVEARARYFEAYQRAMESGPAPEAVLDVTSRHGTTRVYRYGETNAAPIVLLHGLANMAAVWAPHLGALSARHPVYAIDHLGEPGRSVQTAPLVDAADRARWLDDVLAGLGLDGVHLVGASSGGYLAFNQAIHAPVRLASVVLLEPTTVTAKFAPAVLWRALPAVLLNREWAWRWFLRWAAGIDGDQLSRPDVLVTLSGIREHRMRIPPQTCPDEAQIRSVKLPVLALFGGLSVVHDARAAADRAAELLPRAEVELWPESGHYLAQRTEDLVRVNERVLEFVRRN